MGRTYWTIVFANQRDHTPPVAGLVDSSTGMSVAAQRGPRAVTIRWWGKDRPLSTRTAGLRGFTVQYRRGGGDWQPLRIRTKTKQLTKTLGAGRAPVPCPRRRQPCQPRVVDATR